MNIGQTCLKVLDGILILMNGFSTLKTNVWRSERYYQSHGLKFTRGLREVCWLDTIDCQKGKYKPLVNDSILSYLSNLLRKEIGRNLNIPLNMLKERAIRFLSTGIKPIFSLLVICQWEECAIHKWWGGKS